MVFAKDQMSALQLSCTCESLPCDVCECPLFLNVSFCAYKVLYRPIFIAKPTNFYTYQRFQQWCIHCNFFMLAKIKPTSAVNQAAFSCCSFLRISGPSIVTMMLCLMSNEA